MDFGRDEVRDYTFRLIEEAVRRYDCDGIELDFNRFPTFFKDGSTDERVAKMNSLVERVRKMLDDVGGKVVRLKFHLSDAKLYSFQIGGELSNK